MIKKTVSFLLLFSLVAIFTLSAVEDTTKERTELKKVAKLLSDNIVIRGYGQFGYHYTDDKTAQTSNSFYNRTTLLIFSGDITPKLSWMVQYHVSKSTLTEINMSYKPFSFLGLKAGQMKTAFTFENQLSPSRLQTVLWSKVGGAFARMSNDDIGGAKGGRDLGFEVSGDLFSDEKNSLLTYRLGIYNGTGTIVQDDNAAKDFAAALTFHPLKGLDVGTSAYLGRLNNGLNQEIDRNRLALSMQYKAERWNMRSEYMWAKDDHINKDGFYVLGAYYFIPKHLSVVARVEGFSPNVDNAYYEKIYTVGLNYYVTSMSRFMLNYVHSEEQTNSNELWLQFQIGF